MKLILYFLTLCLFLITHPAKAEFSEAEKQQIQQILEEYLNQNPEILFDLIVNYSNQKYFDELVIYCGFVVRLIQQYARAGVV